MSPGDQIQIAPKWIDGAYHTDGNEGWWYVVGVFYNEIHLARKPSGDPEFMIDGFSPRICRTEVL